METMTRTDRLYDDNGDCKFPFELKDEARDIDATEKIKKFTDWMYSFDESFNQVMQISVPLWNSSVHYTDCANITIDKSVDLDNIYISISTTGNIYTLPIEPLLTFETVLSYLWNDVDEFRPYRESDHEYNFKIEKYSGNDAITNDEVLEMHISDVALSQGTLTITRIQTAWWQ